MSSCSSRGSILLQGCSALGLAVGDGHVEVAECLLLAGADVNAKAVKHQVRQSP